MLGLSAGILALVAVAPPVECVPYVNAAGPTIVMYPGPPLAFDIETEGMYVEVVTCLGTTATA